MLCCVYIETGSYSYAVRKHFCQFKGFAKGYLRDGCDNAFTSKMYNRCESFNKEQELTSCFDYVRRVDICVLEFGNYDYVTIQHPNGATRLGIDKCLSEEKIYLLLCYI
jgi:hypothetical protein